MANEIEITEKEKYEKVKNDFLEFIECTKRCIEPNNILLYNIIMNALEITLVRMEHDEQVGSEIITAENLDGVLTTTVIDDGEEKTCYNCQQQQEEKKYYDTSKLDEDVKKEIDDIMNSIIKE